MKGGVERSGHEIKMTGTGRDNRRIVSNIIIATVLSVSCQSGLNTIAIKWAQPELHGHG